MEEKKENPIAVRSKKWITTALFELMDEKRYEDITITDISKKADLVRQTFYKNFSTKEQVLDEYLNTLSTELIETCIAYNEIDVPVIEVAKLHLKFWEKHADLVRILMKHNLIHLLSKCYEKYLLIFNEHFSQKDPLIIKYSSSFIIGGILSIIPQWIKDDFKLSVDDMAVLACSLINRNFFFE